MPSRKFSKSAPKPPKDPVNVTVHNDSRIDPFVWLQDKKDPRVLNYLKEENSYTESVMSSFKPLEEELFNEMKDRIQETDQSVPEKIENYFYYTRTEKGKQYPIFCRKRSSLKSEEQIYLDENKLAEGHPYFDVGAISISPDHKLLAYATDMDGDEIYTIKIFNIDSGEYLNDVITGASSSIEWSELLDEVFYITLDHAHRPYRVYRHKLGTLQEKDILVYEEKDESFNLDVSKSHSHEFLFLESESNTTSEIRYLKSDSTSNSFQILIPREKKVEYFVDHGGDYFYVMTNKDAENFKLLRSEFENNEDRHWEEIIPHNDQVSLEGFDCMETYLSVYKKANGQDSIEFLMHDTGDWHELSFEEEVYTLYPHGNPDFQSQFFRFSYSSLSTPEKIYEFDPDLQVLNLLKTQAVLGGFDEKNYESYRIWATASDEKRIPISIVYRKDLKKEDPSYLHLYGYGSYGHTIEPAFSSNIISLLDRGIIYAIAHVRGGAFLGRQWYDSGKQFNKKNTFSDFTTCAEYLISEGFTSPEKLVIRGGSAGGLLIGNVIQERPDLFHAAIADVPFVDVVNTMLDESLPLTITEYEEWGNPEILDDYKYMITYSPYDNQVNSGKLPHLLVTAGLNDPRVQYWEPAKWVARLRWEDHPNLVMLKTNMGSGHMGLSGRYDYLKEIAFRYSFLIKILKIDEI